MLCQYGAHNTWIDVTSQVQIFFMQEDMIVLPAGPKNFNDYFGDPLGGVVKQLRIHLLDQIIILDERDNLPHQYPISSLENFNPLSSFESEENIDLVSLPVFGYPFHSHEPIPYLEPDLQILDHMIYESEHPIPTHD